MTDSDLTKLKKQIDNLRFELLQTNSTLLTLFYRSGGPEPELRAIQSRIDRLRSLSTKKP